MTTDTIIARRSTFDGKHVCLWSDGTLTWGYIGTAIKGSAHPSTAEQSEQALRAGWLVLGEVELYEAGEVSALITAARWTAKRGGTPGDMRARLVAVSVPKMPGGWTLIATDRDGKVTERAWRFPRLSVFADLAIWNVRGTYQVHIRMAGSTDTFAPNGSACKTLAEAFVIVRDMVFPAASVAS